MTNHDQGKHAILFKNLFFLPISYFSRLVEFGLKEFNQKGGKTCRIIIYFRFLNNEKTSHCKAYSSVIWGKRAPIKRHRALQAEESRVIICFLSRRPNAPWSQQAVPKLESYWRQYHTNLHRGQDIAAQKLQSIIALTEGVPLHAQL